MRVEYSLDVEGDLEDIAGETDKLRKCRYFLRGVWDGLRERMGRLEAR